jgi:hypothetical protein
MSGEFEGHIKNELNTLIQMHVVPDLIEQLMIVLETYSGRDVGGGFYSAQEIERFQQEEEQKIRQTMHQQLVAHEGQFREELLSSYKEEVKSELRQELTPIVRAELKQALLEHLIANEAKH